MKVEVHDRYLLRSLRNCGYDPYTAIADIVDNSIEPNVEATFVKICVDKDNDRGIKSILVGDNGCGMNLPTLKEALALGSETGKNGTTNYGMYGTGLKSSALALGKKLEIITKTKNGDYSYAIFSIENDEVFVDACPLSNAPNGSEKQLLFDEMTECHSGTVVIISSLDRLKQKDYYSFIKQLSDKIGIYFNKIIINPSRKIDFWLNGTKIKSVSLVWENDPNKEIVKEGSFDVDGHIISYKFHYLPSHTEDDTKREKEKDNEDDQAGFSKRTLQKSGFLLYRQNRLVGIGLTLGLYSKHADKNGIRCELFIDGNCDEMFGVTFTKLANDKKSSDLNPTLMEKLKKEITPLIEMCEKRRWNEIAKSRNSGTKELEKRLNKKITEEQNTNKAFISLDLPKFGKNEKRDEGVKEHETRGPQKNPNPTKTRKEGNFGGFKIEQMGSAIDMYTVDIYNSRPFVVINADHYFYKNFFHKLPEPLQYEMARILSCILPARVNTQYYSDENVQKTIDEYYEMFGTAVNQSFRHVE